MSEHIPESDLLLALDGELGDERMEVVLAHTLECATCEEKWMELAWVSRQAEAIAVRDARPKAARLAWRPFAVANTLAAVAVAITCIVLLPSLRHTPHVSPAVRNDVEEPVPAGYVSLPFADPALPVDEEDVLPVQLSTEDLELMGIDTGDAPEDGVKAEVLIGMDGWPRAIRIVE